MHVDDSASGTLRFSQILVKDNESKQQLQEMINQTNDEDVLVSK